MDVKKSKMKKISDFIENCPLLNNGKIDVDYLDDDIDTYSVNQVTAEPIIKRYIYGNSKRQIVFDFTVVAPFSKVENLINSAFCEDFMNWVEKQNSIGNLPKIEYIETIECTGPRENSRKE